LIHIFRKGIQSIFWFTPWERRRRIRFQQQHAEGMKFDTKFGVDTGGIWHPLEGNVVGKNWISGSAYEGVDPTRLEGALTEIDLTYEDFTFVDIGAGKGRALLVASLLPFKEIVGVEYSEAMCDIARRNIERFPRDRMRCTDIEVVCEDAATFRFPDGPLLIYLYNPFQEPVMRQVVENVEGLCKSQPVERLVLCHMAGCCHAWATSAHAVSSQELGLFSLYKLK